MYGVSELRAAVVGKSCTVQIGLKEYSRFFPARETGNLKINMAEADLSSKTFTSNSTSDSDYDISLRIPLKMKTKIHTLKLPVIILIRPRKQCKA